MKPGAADPLVPFWLLSKLRQAAAQGIALASLAGGVGCARTSSPSSDAAPNHGGIPDSGWTFDAAQPSDASWLDASNARDARTTDSPTRAPLPPFPIGSLGCWGPDHDGGYYGQCCVEAHCYTPGTGSECAEAEYAQLRELLPRFPPGSGDCNCSLGPDTRSSISGPYSRELASAPVTEGECCYLVGSIGCTGRPLVVAGQLVIAAVVVRRDWAVFA